MKRHARILAGTAIGLVMVTSPLAHARVPAAVRPAPAAAEPGTTAPRVALPLVFAQAETEAEDGLGRRPKRETPAEASDAEPAPAEEARPEPRPETVPENKPAPEDGAGSDGRSAAPEAKTEAPPHAEEPAPDQPASEQPEVGETDEGRPDEIRPEPRSAGSPEGAVDSVEPDGGEPPADATSEDAPRPAPAPQVAPEAGAPEPEPRPQAPAADGDDAAPAAPAEESRAPQGGQQDGERPDSAQPDGGLPADAGGESQRGGGAPVLDSQKERAGSAETTEGEKPVTGEQATPGEQPAGETPAQQPADQPAQAVAPPADDSAAQEQARPAELEPVTAEEGRRIERRPEDRREERPEGAEVVREIGDRIVIRFNNRILVESDDRPRISRGAREVYYEELPRGRTREVVVRENGVQVVTIRNRYGDVIRRSRIAPDGREYVLVYVEDDYYERVRDWRDPGRDLPPMRLTIPVEEYILDAGLVRDADAYYTFLDQPPVERVERLYSLDEVKRSARIRDKTRRVDLDTITFEFGSASIAESEIQRLEGVARAMERLLEENPAETFLIEGHTDAVGSDIANLALSDRRAEAVAEALTNVFDIPPENLATQGYGEQYLKVKTEAPERENRRVAIRRITPLVAPVASAR
ncbi:MAG TPA: OmpA family protein [Rhizobiales bacterium]|nr:OmpA family protein [Hyphomicrobiales bacterium]